MTDENSNNIQNVMPIEKIISFLSYATMGIVGFIWLIIAHLLKRKIKYFLLYNIYQSLIISISLAIFKILADILFMLISKIHFLDFIVAVINLVLSIKIIRFQSLGFSFNIIELIIFILLSYICIGILLGRIFYIPYLTDFMQKILTPKK